MVISLVIPEFTLARGITNAHFQAVKRAAPGKITCNNSTSFIVQSLPLICLNRPSIANPFDRFTHSYRIHLSPGSRRNSSRSAIARAMNGSVPTLNNASIRRASASSGSPEFPPSLPPQLSAPPNTSEPARAYTISTPPDSPPQLAHATLPATMHPPPESVSSRSSSGPDSPYSPISQEQQLHNNQLVSMSSHPIDINGNSQPFSHYRSGTTTYQEQSQGSGYQYVHHNSVSPPGSAHHGMHQMNNSYSYSGSHYDSRHHPTHRSDNTNSQSASSSPTTHTSRHSISHISHPNPHPRSYPPAHNSNSPSPVSSSNPSPTSPASYYDDPHFDRNGILINHSAQSDHQPNISNGHLNGQLMHSFPSVPLLSAPLPPSSSGSASHSLSGRFDSLSPKLPPIQDERVMKADSRLGSTIGLPQIQQQQHHSHPLHPQHSHSHSAPLPYLHHSQPLATDYPYHQTIELGHSHHSSWKSDGGLRIKGIGALVQ